MSGDQFVTKKIKKLWLRLEFCFGKVFSFLFIYCLLFFSLFGPWLVCVDSWCWWDSVFNGESCCLRLCGILFQNVKFNFYVILTKEERRNCPFFFFFFLHCGKSNDKKNFIIIFFLSALRKKFSFLNFVLSPQSFRFQKWKLKIIIVSSGYCSNSY